MTERLSLLLDRLNTPVGEMSIVADREGNLRFVGWRFVGGIDHEDEMLRVLRQYDAVGCSLETASRPLEATRAILNYFDGDLAAIDALPVQAQGTAFQREVWTALRSIPCGATVSYMRLAGQISRPRAVRAVGLANGANPVAVVVPCHRVIGANGKLTGYGGGIERKAWLLRHEAGHSAQSFTLTP